MRGSPLLRTFVLLLLLAVAGLGLSRLTGRSAAVSSPPVPPPAERPAAALHWPFELKLGAIPAETRLTSPDGRVLFESQAPATLASGTLVFPANPDSLLLQVRWAAPATGHRFAMLTLEPPGRPTLRHVFDAAGDLDDAWELPAGTATTPADE